MKLFNVTPINSGELVHKVFNKPGFIEKTAHRIRLIGYGFVLTAVLAIVIQFLFPFIQNPPNLFMQLLFLLALWGVFEIFSIPLEHFHDFYVVDFEKNWIALSKKRFFYYQVKVLASFNQIKAIGASDQPFGLAKVFKFSKNKKYAIFVQTLKNDLIQISDYYLTLEEANDFCHRLYSTHFSGAAYIGGTPGMQIQIDQNSKTATNVPQKINSEEIFISFFKDISQMVLALALSIIIFLLSIFVIEWAALKFFNTDMQTLKQPFIQLFYHKFQEPIEKKKTEPQPESDKKRELLVTVPIIPHVATKTVNINLNDKKVIIFDASKAKQIENSAQTNKISKTITTTTKNIATEKALVPTEQKIEKTSTEPKQLHDPGPKVSIASEPEAQKPAKIIASKPAKKIKVSPQKADKTIKSSSYKQLIDSKNDISKQPKYHKIRNSIPSIDNQILSKAPQTSSYDRTKELTIIPGRGLVPDLYLNTSFKKLHSTLGKPLSKIKSKNGSQFIYRSFSINTLDDSQQTIVKIVITSENYRARKIISTSENIRIGDSLKIVEQKYGPYTVIKNLPGMHYPEKGISFIAKPNSPDTIGAISIYQSENL
jgi:hypothetical protein